MVASHDDVKDAVRESDLVRVPSTSVLGVAVETALEPIVSVSVFTIVSMDPCRASSDVWGFPTEVSIPN